MTITLEIEDIHLTYEQRAVLSGVSFTVFQGEAVSLLGASGCGKTSLLRLIAGLEKPTQGKIRIFGQEREDPASYISYMTQQELLLPWRTVLENVAIVGELGQHSYVKEEWRAKAEALLQEVELWDDRNTYPAQLSGGMRQRVNLARALLKEAPLLLLDEPFGALDAVTRRSMHKLLHKMRCSLNKTVLLVTHDIAEALAFSEHILLVAQGALVKHWDLRTHLSKEERLQMEMEIFKLMQLHG